MKKVVFVVLSHTLTEAQISDLNADQIILLSDVNPELAVQCRQINPAASLEDVQELAALVVAEAVKAYATHFVCQGEPSLALWANLIASGRGEGWMFNMGIFPKESYLLEGVNKVLWRHLLRIEQKGRMECLQSTTKRSSVEESLPNGDVIKKSVFKHVQWRNMF